MAWNGVGTYVLNPLYSPEVNGTTIDAVRYNGLLSDVATGITQALNKNGENSPTTNINWGAFKITNLGAATTAGDAIAYNQPPPNFTNTANTSVVLQVTNTNASSNAFAGYNAINDIGAALQAGVSGSTYSTIGYIGVNAGYIAGTGAGGLALAASNAAGVIRFAAGGTTEAMRIASTGYIGINQTTPASKFHLKSVSSSVTPPTNIADLVGTMRIEGSLANVAYDGLSYVSGSGGGASVVFGRGTGYDTSITFYTNPNSTAVSGSLATKALEINSIGDLTGKGVAITRVKTANTSRLSTTTLADDPDLTLTLPVGTWYIRAFLPVLNVASTGGYKVGFSFTGTQTVYFAWLEGSCVALTSTGGRDGTASVGQVYAVNSAVGSTASDWLQPSCQITVTVAGTFAVTWAQFTSNANNTTVLAGARLICTKVA